MAVAGRKREGGATARDPGLGRWAPGSLRRVQRPTAADVTPHSTTNFPNSHKLLALLLCAALGHHTAPSSTSLAANSSPRWASWSPVSSVRLLLRNVPSRTSVPSSSRSTCPRATVTGPVRVCTGPGCYGPARLLSALGHRLGSRYRCCKHLAGVVAVGDESAQLREFLRTCRGRERGVARAPPPQALRITEPHRLDPDPRVRRELVCLASHGLAPGGRSFSTGGRDSIRTWKPWSFASPGDVAVPLT